MKYNEIFTEVKTGITGQKFDLARQLTELTEGIGREHNQPCPFCGGKDRFYFRPEDGSFHCRQCGFNGDVIALVAKHRDISQSNALTIVSAAAGHNIESAPPKMQAVKKSVPKAKAAAKAEKLCTRNADYTFDYTAEDGTVLYRKRRIEREGQTKTFRFEPKGITEHVPYHLDGLLYADVLVIHEGELKTDAFNTDIAEHRKNRPEMTQYIGTCLDCGSGSAKQWKEHLEQYPYLTAMPVIIVEDNDTAGGKYALETAQAFYDGGNRNVKIVLLPTGIEGGDYADFQKQQNETGGLPFPKFLKIVEETPEYQPEEKANGGNLPEPAPYVPFPADLLPTVLRNMIIAVHKTIGLKDCSTPAVVALAVVSSIIGASCKIKRKNGWTQPAHIYTAIIQRSGGAKSPAIELLLAPLQQKQKESIAEWKRNVSEYEADLQQWKGLPKKERGDFPFEPNPPERFYVGDITIEALGQKLEENPQGLLLYADELDCFFGNMQRYNNGRDLPHYIEIHNGKPLIIDRKTSGLISVPNPSLSIVGGIQPEILKQQLEENPDFFHSGFIARFFVAMPPFEATRDNDNEVACEVMKAWELLIDCILINRKQAFQDGNVNPFVFSLTEEAKTIFRRHQHHHADLQETAADGAGTIEGKFATNVLRLALILHCVNLADKGGAGFSSLAQVPKETMLAACKITEWFVNEAIRIYAALQSGSTDGTLTPDQREVLSVLRKVSKPLTIREMNRHSRILQRMENIKTVLSELVKAGLLAEKTRYNSETGGQPTFEFSIVDTVDVDGTPKNTGIFGGCGNVNTVNSEKNDLLEQEPAPKTTEPATVEISPAEAPVNTVSGNEGNDGNHFSRESFETQNGQTAAAKASKNDCQRCGICSHYPCSEGLYPDSPTAVFCTEFEYDLNKF